MADKKQRRNNKNYDEDYNPKFRKQRKKVCVLCSDKNFELDYKNADQLKKFVNDKVKSYQEEQQDVVQNIKEILLQQLKELDILLYYHMHNNNMNKKRPKLYILSFGL